MSTAPDDSDAVAPVNPQVNAPVEMLRLNRYTIPEVYEPDRMRPGGAHIHNQARVRWDSLMIFSNTPITVSCENKTKSASWLSLTCSFRRHWLSEVGHNYISDLSNCFEWLQMTHEPWCCEIERWRKGDAHQFAQAPCVVLAHRAYIFQWRQEALYLRKMFSAMWQLNQIYSRTPRDSWKWLRWTFKGLYSFVNAGRTPQVLSAKRRGKCFSQSELWRWRWSNGYV